MKQTAILFAAVVALAAPASADQFDDFKKNVSKPALEGFARDLGGMLGSNVAHSGRSLGFPGFDVGVKMGGMLSIDDDNAILDLADVDQFGMPWIQAEIGMPFKLDGFIRGFSYEGLSLVGGGLRYGLLRVTDLPLTPQLSVGVVGNVLNYSQFSATHFGGNATLSVKALIVEPYVGVGYDRTKVEVKSVDPTNTSGVVDGDTEVGTAPRGTIGINIKPFPLVYINAGYTIIKDHSGFEGGFGVRF